MDCAGLTTRRSLSPRFSGPPVHAGGQSFFTHPQYSVPAVDWTQTLGADCKPTELNPPGFASAVAGNGELRTRRFKLVLLGATDATGGTNLAVHLCSKRL
jgi:hypothetical protein